MEYTSFCFGSVPNDSPDLPSWKLAQDEMRYLKELMEDETITDIFVDRFDKINIMRKGKLETTEHKFRKESEVLSLIEQFARALNQNFNEKSPILDARLPNGSRLNCTHTLITPQGCTLSLRKVPKHQLTKEDFIGSMFNQEVYEYLVNMIKSKDTFLISGNMGSGKTSLLRLLAESVDKDERLITAEDTQELHINDIFPFGMSMEAAKREGSNIELPQLIHATLRQQPDRVWVGELRVAPAVDAFMQIIYTGVTGCAATIHGSSAENAVSRMQYLLASAGNVDYHLTGTLIRGSLNTVVQTHRDPKWGRKVTEIGRILPNGEMEIVFKFDKQTGSFNRLTE